MNQKFNSSELAAQEEAKKKVLEFLRIIRTLPGAMYIDEVEKYFVDNKLINVDESLQKSDSNTIINRINNKISECLPEINTTNSAIGLKILNLRPSSDEVLKKDAFYLPLTAINPPSYKQKLAIHLRKLLFSSKIPVPLLPLEQKNIYL